MTREDSEPSREPQGVLRAGWRAEVGDYAIDGGWSLGGTCLLIADAAGGIHGFNAASGERSWTQSGIHAGGLLALAIHPDGQRFATAGQDGRVLVWSASDGRLLRTIEVASGWVEHVAWSPSGRRIATACSRHVQVFEADGTEIWRSDAHRSTVSAIAWSSASELATACYGRVAFFDGSNGSIGQSLEWKGSLVSMVLSPDGDVVACGSQDKTVHFWRRSSAQDSMMSGYEAKPAALAFDPFGSLLATGGGKEVMVWSFAGNGPEGTEPGSLELHVDLISSLAFAPRGRILASGGRDGGVAIWSLGSDGRGEAIGAAYVAEIIAGLDWRPDGRALAARDARGGVTVWRLGDS